MDQLPQVALPGPVSAFSSENRSQQQLQALYTWLNQFPNLSKRVEQNQVSELLDGVILLEALHYMEPLVWQKESINYGGNGGFQKENIMAVNQGLNKFYKKLGVNQLECFSRKDYIAPDAGKYAQQSEMVKVLELVLGVAVLCESKEQFIGIITELEEETQQELMKVIESVMARYNPADSAATEIVQHLHQPGGATIVELQHKVAQLEKQNQELLGSLTGLETEGTGLRAQNQRLQGQCEQLALQNEKLQESQRFASLFRTLEELSLDHTDIENQLKRVSDLDTALQVQRRRTEDLEKLLDKLKKETEAEKARAAEDLEVEREKVLQLERVKLQMIQLKKKADEVPALQQQVQELEGELREKEETMRGMEVEIASHKHSKDTIKSLREEISKGKVRISQLELEIQTRTHQEEDLRAQISILKKKDEQSFERIRQLQLQIEELTINDTVDLPVQQSDDLQGQVLAELEAKVAALQHQLNLAHTTTSSYESAGSRLLELEALYAEEKRQNLSLSSQMHVLQQRICKLQAENESLQQSPSAASSNEMQQQHDFRGIKERLQAYKERAAQDEALIAQLQQAKEGGLVELKVLLKEKNELVNEIMRLKDETSRLNSQLQEKTLKEQFADKEKLLLETQIDKLKLSVSEERLQEATRSELLELQLVLKSREGEYQEKERQNKIIYEELREAHLHQQKLVEAGFQQRIVQLEDMIDQLNEEVRGERRIRVEVERQASRQEELTASLIMSLGQEFQTLRTQGLSNLKTRPFQQQQSNYIAKAQQKRQSAAHF